MTPERASSLMQEAIILQQKGNHQEALEAYKEMLVHYPGHPDLLQNAGLANVFIGQLEVAESLFLRALQVRPNFDMARCSLVKVWVRLNRIQELREVSKDTNWITVIDEGACKAICSFFFRRDEYENLFPVLKRFLVVAPESVEAHHTMGQALYRLNYAEEAEEYFRASLKLTPQSPAIMIDLARCLFSIHSSSRRKGCEEERRELVGRAVTLAPNEASVLYELGLIHEEDGNFEKAREAFRKALSVSPDFLPVLTHLASTSRDQELDELMIKLEQQLTVGDTFPQQERCRAFQELGKCYDAKGLYDKAFQCFKSGNDLAGEDRTYNQQEHEAYIDNLMGTYGKDVMNDLWPRPERKDKPLFIVGMPRSGTTLLEEILARHPELVVAGEIPFFISQERLQKSFHTMTGTPAFEWEAETLAGAAAKLRDRYNSIVNEVDSGARYVTDKMPFNYEQLGVISYVYPDAKIIHCRRNRLDVALSCYIEAFSGDHTWSLDLEDINHYYVQYEKLMAHWKSVLGERIFELDYESLVDEPEEVMRSLAHFLGLEWSDNVLSNTQKQRSIRTPSNWQVRQPIYKTSKARWKNYKKHIAAIL